MKLSNNFPLSEFIESETATKNKIDNTPTAEVIENLKELCINVLQPLRDKYGKPIVISSGYRCEALNKAVGGSKTSDHMTGSSADIVSKGREKSEHIKLFELIQSLGLSFDQLIFETKKSTGSTWVHVSYRKTGNRKQILHITS